MELLVVLTVIGILATIMTPSLFRKPAYLTRERMAADLEARLAQAITQARASGKAVSVELDTTDAAIAFTPSIGGGGAPLFYPDGSSNGGTLAIDGRPLMTISWLDGQAHRAAR